MESKTAHAFSELARALGGESITICMTRCDVCQKTVPTRYCVLCDMNYCNEGADDDRWCAIKHQNTHEDKETALEIESDVRRGLWSKPDPDEPDDN